VTVLPASRGPWSAWARSALARDGRGPVLAPPTPPPPGTVLDDEDAQLTLWMLYELHYRGFEDADPAAEWEPRVLAARALLEEPFEAALRALAAPEAHADTHPDAPVATRSFADELADLIASAPGSDLAGHLQRHADLEQFRDFMRRRSVYQLKESDPQSFLLPRIEGAAKVALAELQYDEYGAGRPEMLHQRLFADALRGCGLSDAYGAYVDQADARTLAVANAMSLFALHRRLRGAALGHLAAFEATSSVPCRRIVAGVERLGLPAATAAYFDEHVEADAAHEQVAIRGICQELVSAEPHLAEDVRLGARTCLELDRLAGEALLAEWQHAPAFPGRDAGSDTGSDAGSDAGSDVA
jgi:hypothetical protein